MSKMGTQTHTPLRPVPFDFRVPASKMPAKTASNGSSEVGAGAAVEECCNSPEVKDVIVIGKDLQRLRKNDLNVATSNFVCSNSFLNRKLSTQYDAIKRIVSLKTGLQSIDLTRNNVSI